MHGNFQTGVELGVGQGGDGDAASAAAEFGIVDEGVGAATDVVQGNGAAKAAGVGGAEGVFVVAGDRGDRQVDGGVDDGVVARFDGNAAVCADVLCTHVGVGPANGGFGFGRDFVQRDDDAIAGAGGVGVGDRDGVGDVGHQGIQCGGGVGGYAEAAGRVDGAVEQVGFGAGTGVAVKGVGNFAAADQGVNEVEQDVLRFPAKGVEGQGDADR